MNSKPPTYLLIIKTNDIYQFKCPLGGFISENDNVYVGLISTILSRRLTVHLSDITSIAQHLKTFLPYSEIQKILTENITK